MIEVILIRFIRIIRLGLYRISDRTGISFYTYLIPDHCHDVEINRPVGVIKSTQSSNPSPPSFLIISLLLNYNVDNAVLAYLLPGIVDGTIDLVLRNQGPRSSDEEKDSSLLPGAFKLLFDESQEFEFIRPHQSV